MHHLDADAQVFGDPDDRGGTDLSADIEPEPDPFARLDRGVARTCLPGAVWQPVPLILDPLVQVEATEGDVLHGRALLAQALRRDP